MREVATEIGAPEAGCFSDTDQYWTVRPVAEWTRDERRRWIQIGGPGVDGIQFGFLERETGVHAYYPYEDRFERIASSVPELITGWVSGAIKV